MIKKTIWILTLASAAVAATTSRSIWDGVFSTEQVARGKKFYGAQCADCHGEALEGIDKASPLKGPVFLKIWTNKSVHRLIDQTRRTMPPDEPNTFTRELCADVAAYILSENGYPTGQSDLAHDAPDIRQIILEPKR